MLTKKDCEKALSMMCEGKKSKCIHGDGITAYGVIRQLIIEHFELKENFKTLAIQRDSLLEEYGKLRWNPPLEFEDLKTNMWVWDKRTKAYAKIRHLLIRKITNSKTKEKRNEPRIKFKWGEVIFEENRFFRFEVKEDD